MIKDQDSDEDEDIDKCEKEDWIDFIEKSTKEAEEPMKKTKIPCWIETHRRLKWRMVLRLASLPHERWTNKIIEWNPGLDKIRTNRSVGRPRKRCEDDINVFLKPEATKEAKGIETKKTTAQTAHGRHKRKKKKKEQKQKKKSVQRTQQQFWREMSQIKAKSFLH